jgi:hypothetical protein
VTCLVVLLIPTPSTHDSQHPQNRLFLFTLPPSQISQGPMGGRSRGRALGIQCANPRLPTPEPANTKESSDSQDSAPLSDPHKVTHIVDGTQRMVKAPEGALHLSIQCCSTRLAAHMTVEPPDPAKLLNLSTPCDIFSRTSPIGKKSVGWRYAAAYDGGDGMQGSLRAPGNPHGNVDGLRNINTTLADPQTQKNKPSIGRKCAATSEPPGSNSHMKGPTASSGDFPDDHWIEPMSDNTENFLLKSPARITGTQHTRSESKASKVPPTAPTSSPMKVDPCPMKGKPGAAVTPISSPVSLNPLLAKKSTVHPLSPGFPNAQDPNDTLAELPWPHASWGQHLCTRVCPWRLSC